MNIDEDLQNNYEKIEWHKLFNSWEEAGAKCPSGELLAIRFGLRKVCLSQTTKGFHAFEDACPHKMVKLSKGHLEDDTVICPWHQYCFDVNSGKELTGKNIRDLKHYPLEERKDGIYLGLPSEDPFKDEFSF